MCITSKKGTYSVCLTNSVTADKISRLRSNTTVAHRLPAGRRPASNPCCSGAWKVAALSQRRSFCAVWVRCSRGRRKKGRGPRSSTAAHAGVSSLVFPTALSRRSTAPPNGAQPPPSARLHPMAGSPSPPIPPLLPALFSLFSSTAA
jgi:hypothetical protein